MAKIFVTVHNAALDLCTGKAQCGRGVLSLRMFRLSANVVPSASTQVCAMLCGPALVIDVM